MPIPLSPAAKLRLRDFGICLSLGNLCLIRRWYDLEHLQDRSVNYYRVGPPDHTLLTATLIAATLLAFVFWACWQLTKRSSSARVHTLARGSFLAVLIFPLESVRRYWNQQIGHVDVGSNVALAAIELCLVFGMFLAFRGNLRVLRAAKRVALVMLLLLPSLLFDFFARGSSEEPREAFAPKPLLPLLPAKVGADGKLAPRLIWVLFDEMDERIAFDARPDNLELPELDRLKAESFSATQAVQTASWTVLAIPSLLTGMDLAKAQMMDATTLQLYPEGNKASVSWNAAPNVFRRARDLGANAALVGWHHPYCRVLSESFVRCLDVPSGHPTDALLRETHAAEDGVWATVAFLFRLQLENTVDLFRSDKESHSKRLKDEYVQRRQLRQYFRIRERAYRDAVDPRIGFLFLHFPAPHYFAIYDRDRKDFTLSDDTDYLDNLALVDRTVGELRRNLEQAGLWDSTSLLITADHGFRPDEWRGRLNWTDRIDRITAPGQSFTVPFILKLAGEHEGAVYGQRFSSVVTGDLALAVLSGEVTSPNQALAWVEKHTDQTHLSTR